MKKAFLFVLALCPGITLVSGLMMHKGQISNESFGKILLADILFAFLLTLAYGVARALQQRQAGGAK